MASILSFFAALVGDRRENCTLRFVMPPASYLRFFKKSTCFMKYFSCFIKLFLTTNTFMRKTIVKNDWNVNKWLR